MKEDLATTHDVVLSIQNKTTAVLKVGLMPLLFITAATLLEWYTSVVYLYTDVLVYRHYKYYYNLYLSTMGNKCKLEIKV